MPEEKKPMQKKGKSNHYVAPFTLIDDLLNIRQLYLKAIEKDETVFTQKPWPVTAFFGKTKGTVRDKQLLFIEKFMIAIQHQIIDANNFEKHLENPKIEQNEAVLIESQLVLIKVLIAVCLYVRHSITEEYSKYSPFGSPSNSKLYTLVNQILAISDKNSPEKDISTLRICCQTAYRLINNQDELNKINAKLNVNGVEKLSEEEWTDFKTFLEEKVAKEEKQKEFRDWPFSSLTECCFGYIGGAVGATFGYVFGAMVAFSNKTDAGKNRVASMFSSLANQGAVGTFVATAATTNLIAPFLAYMLVNHFLKILPAASLYEPSKKAGQIAGRFFGYCPDKCLQLATYLYENGINNANNPKKGISGLQIADGHLVKDGYIVTPDSVLIQDMTATEETKDESASTAASSSYASSSLSN